MSRKGMFLAGAFGGATPTLLRLALDLVSRKESVEHIDRSILAGIALLAFLGAGLAVIWNEADPKKAFYIGLGLPSLVTVLTTSATAPNLRRSSQEAPPPFGSVLAAPSIPNRYLRIEYPFQETGQLLAVYDLDGHSTINPVSGGVPLSVPFQATSVTFASENASPFDTSLPTSPGSLLSIRFIIEKVSWYGFQYAIGIQTKPFKLVVDGNPRVSEPQF